jgi:hypothetical protein
LHGVLIRIIQIQVTVFFITLEDALALQKASNPVAASRSSQPRLNGSQIFEVLLDETNSSADVWIDATYCNKARDQALIGSQLSR